MAVGLSQLFGSEFGRTNEIRPNQNKLKSKKSEFSDLLSSGKISSTASKESKDTYVKSSGTEVTEQAVETVRYPINKMSQEDRSALVEQMKDEQNQQQAAFLENVKKSFTSQADTFLNARAVPTLDENGFWRFIASGNYPVDAETKVQAQNAISVDGFYGVKKTSQRLFDFAAAMAGDDVETMKKMQEAVTQGFNDAKEVWGKDLPTISNDTLEATNKLFEEYYASKAGETTQAQETVAQEFTA